MKGRPKPYKTQDDRWRVAFVNGEGQRQYLSGGSRADVESKLTDALLAMRQGLPATASSDLLGVYLDRWLAGKRGTLKPKTWQGYESNVRLYLQPGLGRAKISLGPEQIQAFYQRLEADGVGPYAINSVHRVFRTAMEQAYGWRLVQRNAVKLAKPPRLPEKPPRIFDDEQFRLFLEAVQGHENELVFVLALTTGMRQSEILGLRWKDIDFVIGEISVVQQRYRGIAGTLKTTAAKRRLKLTTTALALLHELRTARTHVALDSDSDYVFPGVQSATLFYQFKRILKKSGLPNIRFHDLRHTYATHLLRAGVSPHATARLLGHKDPATALRVYAQFLPDDQRLAVEAINRLTSTER